MAELNNQCSYCKKIFKQEKTMFVHMCEQKRRVLAKDEKANVVGYSTFVRFFKVSQPMVANKTYFEFCTSPYYSAFIKFGSFVTNVKPLYPDKFVEYIVTSGIKLDHWCKEEHYDKYVVELIKNEPVETALIRGVNHMLSWAEDSNAEWSTYFTKVSLPRATYDIKDGKISPWLLLNSTSGKSLLKKLDDKQLEAITKVINPVFWVEKFKKQKDDVELTRKVIMESKL